MLSSTHPRCWPGHINCCGSSKTVPRATGVACSAVIEQGSRSDKALMAAAEACGCDLMLMVSTGRGAFGEALFGSQTKAVLAGCRLPMLLLLPQ